MRYFTRGWMSGELTDAETERTGEAYRARVAEIAPRLPPAMLRLTRDFSLHDALVERIVWNPTARCLRLSLVCGNVQRGHSLAQLTYDRAMLGQPRVDSLKRAAECRHTELVYDEVDVEDDGHLSHRLLFVPSEEVTIEFERFDMTVSPRPDRRVELLGPFLEEGPDDEAGADDGTPAPG